VASTPPQTHPMPPFANTLYNQSEITSFTSFKPLLKSSNDLLDAQEITTNLTSNEFVVRPQELSSNDSLIKPQSSQQLPFESITQISHKESPKGSFRLSSHHR